MKNICHNFYRKIIFNASALLIHNPASLLFERQLSVEVRIEVPIYYQKVYHHKDTYRS